MRIHLHSDLHLEFNDHRLPGGDLLLLAGDICTARHLDREDVSASPKGQRYADFFADCGKKYANVLMIPGNHEAYGTNVSRVVGHISQHIPKNMIVSEQGAFHFGDWVFLVGTAWTDMNKGDPVTHGVVSGAMNDFRMIRYGDSYARFTTHVAAKLHRQFIAWLKGQLETYKDKRVFVMTHHAPSFASIPERFRGELHLNGGFASDLSELILESPQIRYWAHGHIHDTVDYEIGTTKIISNPRGYVPSESNHAYDPNHTIELD